MTWWNSEFVLHHSANALPMAIIKRAASTARPRRAVFNFDDLSRQADAVLDKARGQADAIVAEAHRQVESVRADQEAAAERSIEARIEEQAARQLKAKVDALLPAVEEAVAKIGEARAEWIARWEKQAVTLAAAIAARVVRRELAADPKITLALLREALELAGGTQTLRIRLHASDHASLGAAAEELANRLSPRATVKIVADPEVSPGGCIVHTDHGTIDQCIETQLRRIEEELLA